MRTRGGKRMNHWRVYPYRSPEEVAALLDRLGHSAAPLVHPQRILAQLRRERSAIGRFNGWLADHIVGLAGTMAFFYFLCILMAGWAFWQSGIEHNHGFDPYSFLSFLRPKLVRAQRETRT
jgi:uncharacterized membrane protein